MQGIGKVYVSGFNVYYRVSVQKDVASIIEIFKSNPLNSTKHLNFLDFAEAFNI